MIFSPDWVTSRSSGPETPDARWRTTLTSLTLLNCSTGRSSLPTDGVATAPVPPNRRRSAVCSRFSGTSDEGVVEAHHDREDQQESQ